MERQPVNAAELAALTGVAPSQITEAKMYAQTLVIDFGTFTNSTKISKSLTVLDGQVFVVDELAGWPWLYTASTAIKGTPLITEGHQTLGSNTWQSAWPITLSVQINNRTVSGSGIELPSLLSPTGRTYPGTPWIFPAKATVGFELDPTACANYTYSFKLALHGRYIKI